MATYFVSGAGSNTAPYETWAKAATSLATACAAASTAGDVIVIQYDNVPSADEEQASSTTYTFTNRVALVSASADDASTAYTPTAMGTTNWLGHTSSARVSTFAGAHRVYVYGVTFRQPSTGTGILNSSDGGQFVLESCLFWQQSTASNSSFQFGNSGNCYTKTINCTVRSDKTGTNSFSCTFGGLSEHVNLTLDVDVAPSTGLCSAIAANGHQSVRFMGCDLSQWGASGLVSNNDRQPAEVEFIHCKLPSSYTILTTQTSIPNRGSAKAWVFDCHSGDTHGIFGYYDAQGSVVTDSGVYFTSGAAAQSWKITTSANVSPLTPFESPWIDLYHTGTSAITPYVEILRSGAAGGTDETVAFKDSEVWAEFSAKTTSGSTQSSFTDDRDALLDILTGVAGTDQAAGAGLASWTGEGAEAWSGKISGASMTPAESGHIRGRVVVGIETVVYVDPQIRT